jgi:hypothetical protein
MIRLAMIWVQKPAHMGPQKSMVPWRMGILNRIGTGVMMAMGGGPPKRAKLG